MILLWTCLFAALGGFLFGYDLGLIGGALLQIERYFGVRNSLTLELVVGAAKLGAAAGTFLGGAAMARYGRQRALALNSIAFAAGPVIMALASAPWMLILGRFVLGLGIGVSAIVSPSYIAELAPATIRGTLVQLYEVMLCIGMLSAPLVDWALSKGDPDSSWRLMVGLPALPALVLAAAPLVLPESPRWLVTRNRLDEALAVLTNVMRGSGRIARQPESGYSLIASKDSAAAAMAEERVVAQAEDELLQLWSGVELDRNAVMERRRKLWRRRQQETGGRRWGRLGYWKGTLGRTKPPSLEPIPEEPSSPHSSPSLARVSTGRRRRCSGSATTVPDADGLLDSTGPSGSGSGPGPEPVSRDLNAVFSTAAGAGVGAEQGGAGPEPTSAAGYASEHAGPVLSWGSNAAAAGLGPSSAGGPAALGNGAGAVGSGGTTGLPGRIRVGGSGRNWGWGDAGSDGLRGIGDSPHHAAAGGGSDGGLLARGAWTGGGGAAEAYDLQPGCRPGPDQDLDLEVNREMGSTSAGERTRLLDVSLPSSTPSSCCTGRGRGHHPGRASAQQRGEVEPLMESAQDEEAGAQAGKAVTPRTPAALYAMPGEEPSFLHTLATLLADIGALAGGSERRALGLALGLAFFNQITASTAIINYAPRLMRLLVGGQVDEGAAMLYTAGIAVTKAVGVVAALLMVDRCGRRPLLIWGSLACAAALAAVTAAALADSAALLAAAMCGFSGFFSLSWAGLYWVVVSELFSMTAKSAATSAATGLLFLTGAVTNLIFLSLQDLFGPHVFLLFAALSLVAAAYVATQLPETKGRTLAEVQALLAASSPGDRGSPGGEAGSGARMRRQGGGEGLAGGRGGAGWVQLREREPESGRGEL